MIGSLLADRISRRLTPGRSLFVSMVGMGLGFLTVALVPSAVVFWLAGLGTGLMIV